MNTKIIRATPQQLAASQPTRSVWVSANAGAGKTHVLVERVIRLMLDGAKPASILCLTFTKAAAAEMADRLYRRLGRWIALDDQALDGELAQLGVADRSAEYLKAARRLFTQALETPGGLKIQTIHAFCERILQLFPIEANIAPGFKVMEERQTKDLMTRATTRILKSAADHQNPELAAALATVVKHSNSADFDFLLRKMLSPSQGLGSHLNNAQVAKAAELLLKAALQLEHDDDAKRLQAEILEFDRQAYQQAGDVFATIDQKTVQVTAETLRALSNCRDEDILFADLRGFFFTGEFKPRATMVSKKIALAEPAMANWLNAEQARLVNLYIAHDLHVRVAATRDLITIVSAISQSYENEKRSGGLYDFDDLIAKTALLLTKTHQASWILYKLDAQLQHILVDEAQDTSPVQWEIIGALAQEFFPVDDKQNPKQRTLFVVGDYKQSIYRFQGADVASFGRAKIFFSEQLAAGTDPLLSIDLTVSYRTSQDILEVVDQVFGPAQRARLGLDGEALRDFTHQTQRIGAPGVFQIWPLIAPEQKEETSPWLAPVDQEPAQAPRRKLARKIAETIQHWITRGRILTAENRPVNAGDILILFQKRSSLFGALVSELRKLGVPVAGADRLKLLESLAVQDVLAMVQFVVLPSDDYSLACILKSPLVPHPVTEDQLMDLAFKRAPKTLWQKLQEATDQDLLRNADWLSGLLEKSIHARPFDFCAALLQVTRVALVGRLGAEALDATQALLDLALLFEQEHGSSLAGFLHWFTATESEIKREMESGAGQVRLMTVHGAKGLEANIVILADAIDASGGAKGSQVLRAPQDRTALPTFIWGLSKLAQSPILESWKDHAKVQDVEERNRLLYVAMTRARNELYVCGARGKNSPSDESWYIKIVEALQEKNPRLNLRLVPDCLGAGEVWHHGADMAWGAPDTAPQAIYGNVPPWAKADVPIKPERQVEKRVQPIVASSDMQLGTLVHGILEDMPKLEKSQQLNFAIRKCARAGLPPALAQSLVDILEKPELAVFFGPTSQSEVEFETRSMSDIPIRGRVDRLVITDRQMLILDYKSDRQPPAALLPSHPYAQQMARYQTALKAGYPDLEIKIAILWLAHAKLEWLDDALLQAASAYSA